MYQSFKKVNLPSTSHLFSAAQNLAFQGHRKVGPLGIPQGYGWKGSACETRSPGIAVPILEAPWRKKLQSTLPVPQLLKLGSDGVRSTRFPSMMPKV